MRTFRLVVLGLLAVTLVLGCGAKRTYVAPGGKVTVNEKGGKAKSVQVETREGKATIDVSKKSITEAELGAPVYPGAAVEVSGNYEGTAGEAKNVKQTTLTTPDVFDKVFDFYKSHLKNVTNTVNQGAGDAKMGMFSAKSADGSEIAVHIMADKSKNVTTIQVVTVTKPK